MSGSIANPDPLGYSTISRFPGVISLVERVMRIIVLITIYNVYYITFKHTKAILPLTFSSFIASINASVQVLSVVIQCQYLHTVSPAVRTL